MRPLARLAAVCLALAAGACGKLDTFACAQSSECVHDGLAGTCEPGGLCSFPDGTCPSGKKYGEFAGDQSGLCVEPGATSAPTTVPTTGDTSATTSQPLTGESTDPDTTNDPSQVSASTSSTTDPSGDPTTDPSTTTGPTCAELNESCSSLECCSPCMVCDPDTVTCIPAPPETGAMVCGGACMRCDDAGQCAPQPVDTACTTDCNLLVWQSKVDVAATLCLGYADMPLASTCDEFGQCKTPAVAACPDPSLMPGTEKTLAQCDTVCLAPDAATLCTQGAPAAAVNVATYCALGQAPMCSDACVLDMNMMPASDAAACDAMGVCTHTVSTCTGGFKCDEASKECLDKCNDDGDCVGGNCMGSKCM